jgi:hypothetical protein
MSVVQGGTLELHVRSQLPNYRVRIFRQGRQLDPIAVAGTYIGRNFALPAESWERGCGWPVTCRIPIDPAWLPGAYLARVEHQTTFTWIPFVVRARDPGAYGRILVQLSTNTWQAYNRHGGKSFYGAYAPGASGPARRLSFHRPYDYYATDGSGQLFLWEAPFLSFLESRGYDYEVCTNFDLHRYPGLLDSYRLFVSVGHDEYYSKEMFDELERFADAGGNLAFFSGNTIWWQVRFEDEGQTMVCYKSAALDPLTGIDDARVTVNWPDWPVRRSPARLTGLVYNGSWGVPTGGYQVVDPDHWAYRGVAVDSGQTFGSPMVGFEIDSRSADSPPVLDVIARTDLPDANNGGVLRACEMVYHERTAAYGFPGGGGAKIFAAGTVNYTQGLVPGYIGWIRSAGREDPIAQAVTANVLDRLACGIAAPRVGRPRGDEVVRGPRALLQWTPARPWRATAPVQYQVFWQAHGAAAPESAGASGSSLLVPVLPGLGYRWWVRAAGECGAPVASPIWSFATDTESDLVISGPGPALSCTLAGDRLTIALTVSTAERATVDIHNARGQRLAAFAPVVLSPGTTRLEWDLHAAGGGRVASGIYYLRARIGATEIRRPLPLVR